MVKLMLVKTKMEKVPNVPLQSDSSVASGQSSKPSHFQCQTGRIVPLLHILCPFFALTRYDSNLLGSKASRNVYRHVFIKNVICRRRLEKLKTTSIKIP